MTSSLSEQKNNAKRNQQNDQSDCFAVDHRHGG